MTLIDLNYDSSNFKDKIAKLVDFEAPKRTANYF